MISLVPSIEIKSDLSDSNREEKAPHAHQSIALSPIEEGEYVILKDTKNTSSIYRHFNLSSIRLFKKLILNGYLNGYSIILIH